jgi:hypothetical protein
MMAEPLVVVTDGKRVAPKETLMVDLMAGVMVVMMDGCSVSQTALQRVEMRAV